MLTQRLIADHHPKLEPLFGDIAQHIISLQQASNGGSVDPPSKKRKLENGHNGTTTTDNGWKTARYSTIKEVSFTIPQRKKLSLEIGDSKAGIRARNPATDEVEFAVSWEDMQHVVCLPVPEKAQAQYNFCIFPTHGDGITSGSGATALPDQILWTIPHTTPKPGVCSDDVQPSSDESMKSVLVKLLNERLAKRKGSKCRVIEPDMQEFVSEAVSSSKTGQKAVHVKAFRGSKDGFLFFLSTGIVWGFKKPLIFFAFDAIDSVSYTSVLQRTFNLSISARGSGPEDEPQEFELGMIDQADFAGIDAYIKRHQLQDASLAEQRRAKKFNVNGVKGENGQEEEDGPGELQKAAMEVDNTAQNDDDDDEEDDDNFDPGSEGQSEGSGTSDEGEDGDEAAGNADDDDAEDE